MEPPPPSSEPAPVQPDTPPAETKPAFRHTRNGFVARLPKALRDRACEMIQDGFTHRQIIDSLGDAGKHLDESHITTWKAGGYKDWLLEMQRADDLGATRDAALSLVKQEAGSTVQDAGRTIAAAQLYELLLSFDPRAFAGAISDKPELYFRLVNSLSRLSEGEASCSRHRAQKAALANQIVDGKPNGKASIPQEQLKQLLHLIKLL